ncbi:MAG: N-acetylmuramoyl-L-alanine amidase [Clostridia bacterium]|nr:N-acetylmuramoyl-L-alanine amidase [Clostridia bacterium]
MKIIECMHTQSRCYGKKRQAIKPVGIVVHSTGANNSSIKRYSQPSDNDPRRSELLSLIGVNKYGNHWNRSATSKAVHYFVGKLADGTVGVVQNLPEDIAAWGSGKGKNGSYNYEPTGHIQFEICEDNLKNKEYFDAVYRAAVELCADICRRYGWKSSVIVSHREAHAKGYASNHSDIDHWLLKFGLTMNDFRSEVDKLLTPKKEETPKEEKLYRVQVGAYSKRENAEEMKAKLISDGYPAIIKED